MFFVLLQWWQPRCIVKNIFLKFCKCQPRYSYKIYSHWKVCRQLLQLRKERQKNLGLPCRKPEFLRVSTIASDYLYNKMSTFLRCLQYQNMSNMLTDWSKYCLEISKEVKNFSNDIRLSSQVFLPTFLRFSGQNLVHRGHRWRTERKRPLCFLFGEKSA